MTKIDVVDGRISVRIAFRPVLDATFEFQPSEVTVARVDPQGARWSMRGLAAPGMFVPGVLAKGLFHRPSGREFWDVHGRGPVLVLDVTDQRAFSRVVATVDDPERIARAIEKVKA